MIERPTRPESPERPERPIRPKPLKPKDKKMVATGPIRKTTTKKPTKKGGKK